METASPPQATQWSISGRILLTMVQHLEASAARNKSLAPFFQWELVWRCATDSPPPSLDAEYKEAVRRLLEVGQRVREDAKRDHPDHIEKVAHYGMTAARMDEMESVLRTLVVCGTLPVAFSQRALGAG